MLQPAQARSRSGRRRASGRVLTERSDRAPVSSNCRDSRCCHARSQPPHFAVKIPKYRHRRDLKSRPCKRSRDDGNPIGVLISAIGKSCWTYRSTPEGSSGCPPSSSSRSCLLVIRSTSSQSACPRPRRTGGAAALKRKSHGLRMPIRPYLRRSGPPTNGCPPGSRMVVPPSTSMRRILPSNVKKILAVVERVAAPPPVAQPDLEEMIGRKSQLSPCGWCRAGYREENAVGAGIDMLGWRHQSGIRR